MPHRIVVAFRVVKMNKRFRKFIADNEVVRDVVFTFNLKLTNIGTEEFPGGEIGLLKLEQLGVVAGAISVTYNAKALDKIPRIAPDASIETEEYSASLSWEGPVKVSFNFRQTTAFEVQFFWKKGSDPYAGEWTHIAYSVSKEQILMLDYLKRMLERLEDIGGLGPTGEEED